MNVSISVGQDHRLPYGYICEDLSWNPKTVERHITELVIANIISHDSNAEWILLHDFFKWDPIENPNQGKRIEKLFDQIPREVKFFTKIIRLLVNNSKYLSPASLTV